MKEAHTDVTILVVKGRLIMHRRILIWAAALLLCAGVITGCNNNRTTVASGALKLSSQGMSLIEEGKFDDAIMCFDSSIAEDVNNREAYRGKGIALFNQCKYSDAIEQFNKAIEISKNEFDDIRLDAMKYCAKANYNLGLYKEAIVLYSSIIDKSSDGIGEAYFRRGSSYAMLQNENQAVLDYEQAIERLGTGYEICGQMYDVMMKAGYADRAQSYLRRLINNGDNSDKLFIGSVYYRLEEYEKAIDYLKSAYNLGETSAIYYLTLCMEKTNQVNTAEVYEQHITKYPDEAGVYNQYAAYLINTKEYDAALKIIGSAKKIAVDYDETIKAGLLYNEGVCLEFMGRFDEAREVFKKYVESYPGNAAAEREYEFLLSR